MKSIHILYIGIFLTSISCQKESISTMELIVSEKGKTESEINEEIDLLARKSENRYDRIVELEHEIEKLNKDYVYSELLDLVIDENVILEGKRCSKEMNIKVVEERREQRLENLRKRKDVIEEKKEEILKKVIRYKGEMVEILRKSLGLLDVLKDVEGIGEEEYKVKKIKIQLLINEYETEEQEI